MSTRFCGFVLGGLVSLTAGVSTHAHGCDCHTLHTIRMAMPTYGGFVLVHPMLHDESADPSDVNHSMLSAPVGPGFYGVGAPEAVPSGTLGHTYTRVSHPIPLDKHPRTGMLAVKDNGTVPFLTVGVMGGVKMKNGIWLFESTRPLDPGACQIVRVEARQTPQDVEPYASRFVRLIPGRIVYLEF